MPSLPDPTSDPHGKILTAAMELRRVAYLISERQPHLANPLLAMARAIEDCAYAPYGDAVTSADAAARIIAHYRKSG